MPILVEDSVVIHGLILEQPIITDWAYFAGLGFQLIQSLLILGSPIIIIAWLIRQSTEAGPAGPAVPLLAVQVLSLGPVPIHILLTVVRLVPVTLPSHVTMGRALLPQPSPSLLPRHP